MYKVTVEAPRRSDSSMNASRRYSDLIQALLRILLRRKAVGKSNSSPAGMVRISHSVSTPPSSSIRRRVREDST